MVKEWPSHANPRSSTSIPVSEILDLAAQYPRWLSCQLHRLCFSRSPHRLPEHLGAFTLELVEMTRQHPLGCAIGRCRRRQPVPLLPVLRQQRVEFLATRNAMWIQSWSGVATSWCQAAWVSSSSMGSNPKRNAAREDSSMPGKEQVYRLPNRQRGVMLPHTFKDFSRGALSLSPSGSPPATAAQPSGSSRVDVAESARTGR